MVKVILSFDDGREDNYRAAEEIMKELGIPGTFNITTGYVLNTIKDNEKPGPHKPMSLEHLKQLANIGIFEIAGHGYTHDNEIDNLIFGVKELRKLISNENMVQGVASPNSEFDLSKIEVAKETFELEGIKYLRVSNDYSKLNLFKKILRRLNRIFRIPYIYYFTNKDSIVESPQFLMYSIPVIRDTTLDEVRYFLEKAIEYYPDSICIFMFHSILKKGEEYYDDLFSWDFDEYKKLCEYLSDVRKAGRVAIVRNEELYE